jgi:hypothetical protein
MTLTVNRDYFLKQHWQVMVKCCFLCGTDWILKYVSFELRLQRVKWPCGLVQLQLNYLPYPLHLEFKLPPLFLPLPLTRFSAATTKKLNCTTVKLCTGHWKLTEHHYEGAVLIIVYKPKRVMQTTNKLVNKSWLYWIVVYFVLRPILYVLRYVRLWWQK